MLNFAYPYVYICTHKITNRFYIGYRESNTCYSLLDFPDYKTSSNEVKPLFDEFNWQIFAEFFDGKSAYDFEQYLIYQHWNNPLLINKNCHYNKKRFRNTSGLRGKANPRYGVPVSNSTKEKMSRAKKGKRPPNFNAWVQSASGTTWYSNPKTQHQLRLKHGDKIPPGYVKGNISTAIDNSKNPRKPTPVKCIELGIEFPTLIAAAEHVGLKQTRDIVDSIIGRNQRKSAGRYHWQFVSK